MIWEKLNNPGFNSVEFDGIRNLQGISGLFPNWPRPMAELSSKGDGQIVQRTVAPLPWAHNVVLMQKVKDLGREV